MKILFLPNWKVHQLAEDSPRFQAPDKQVRGMPYWFFRHFPEPTEVDIIDFQEGNPLRLFEQKANAYIWQGLKAFPRRRRYDLILSHGAQSALMLSLLGSLPFAKLPPHVIFDIGSMNGGRSNRLENTIIGTALRSGPYSICHSRVVIDNYRRDYPDMVPRSRYVPFGVDIEDFVPMPDVAQEDYVLSFGTAKRDYETLLSAWHGIRTTCRLRLIGYRGAAAALPDNVEVLGKVSIPELKRQIAAARFVVVPLPVFNYSYGQMSFLQSMSMAKAVIVTRTPSSVDYLADSDGAVLAEPYDSEDLRARICRYLDHPDEAVSAGMRARELVVANFSEQAMAQGVFDYLSTIVAQRQHR